MTRWMVALLGLAACSDVVDKRNRSLPIDAGGPVCSSMTCDGGAPARCGNAFGPCCDNGFCGINLVCAGGVCQPSDGGVTCGFAQRPCCPGDVCLDRTTVCTGGVCVANPSCGYAQGPCCSGGVCDGGLLCDGSICQTIDGGVCGAPYGPCCPGNQCGSGFMCVGGVCGGSLDAGSF